MKKRKRKNWRITRQKKTDQTSNEKRLFNERTEDERNKLKFKCNVYGVFTWKVCTFAYAIITLPSRKRAQHMNDANFFSVLHFIRNHMRMTQYSAMSDCDEAAVLLSTPSSNVPLFDLLHYANCSSSTSSSAHIHVFVLFSFLFAIWAILRSPCTLFLTVSYWHKLDDDLWYG